MTEAGDRVDVRPFAVGVVVVSIAIAGILAFHTASSLVDARAAGRHPTPYLPKLLKAATAFLGMGLGAFLTIWLDLLS